MTTTFSDLTPDRLPRRTRITLTHASILVVIGLGFAVNTVAGGLFGAGLYPFLLTNHMACIGLIQAYLLMSVVGLSIWTGYRTSPAFSRGWHLLAIVAHLPPLVALLFFAAGTPELTVPVIIGSLLIHFTGIGFELYALTRKN